MALEQLIENVPNFPKEGILFKDVTPIFQHKFDELIDVFAQKLPTNGIDYLVGIESRGFILASALAVKLGKGFIPIRKKGKLPPPVHAQSYQLEYGEDTLEVKDRSLGGKGLLIDDVIATGGTMRASLELCKKIDLNILALGCLIHIEEITTDKFDDLPVIKVFD